MGLTPTDIKNVSRLMTVKDLPHHKGITTKVSKPAPKMQITTAAETQRMEVPMTETTIKVGTPKAGTPKLETPKVAKASPAKAPGAAKVNNQRCIRPEDCEPELLRYCHLTNSKSEWLCVIRS